MTAVAFSPNGERLAMGGGWWDEPASAIVVSTSHWHLFRTLWAHANQIGTVLFLDDDTLITGSADRQVAMSSMEPDQEPRSIRSLPSPVQAIAMRRGREQLAVAAGNSVHLWRLSEAGRIEDGPEELMCRGHKRVVKAIDFSPDGRLLASVGEDGTLRFWHPDTGAASTALDLGLGGLRAVAFAPDGLTILAAGDAGTIAMVDVDG